MRAPDAQLPALCDMFLPPGSAGATVALLHRTATQQRPSARMLAMRCNAARSSGYASGRKRALAWTLTHLPIDSPACPMRALASPPLRQMLWPSWATRQMGGDAAGFKEGRGLNSQNVLGRLQPRWGGSVGGWRPNNRDRWPSYGCAAAGGYGAGWETIC